MASFNITPAFTEETGNVLKVGFGTPAQNDEIVRDVNARLDELINDHQLDGGGLLKVTGPASLPVAFVLAHKLVHLFSAIGVFDPKLNKYVIAVSHDPAYNVGDLVD